MRSQGGSHIHAGHRIRLTIGPADVRLLFDARLRGHCGAVRPIQRVHYIVLFDEFPVAAGLRRLAKEYFIPFVNDDVCSTVNAGGTIVS